MSNMLAWLVLCVALILAPGGLGLNENTSGANDRALKARDNLEWLPIAFDSQSLPVNQTGDLCWPHLGCVTKIVTEEDEGQVGPDDMNAAFSFSRDGQEDVVIRYQETRVCLKDGKTCQIYPYDLSLLKSVNFNPKLRTVIAIPGWNSGEFDPFVKKVRDAWQGLEKVNLIMVAWTGGSKMSLNSFYDKSAASTKVIARQTVVLLHYLSQMPGMTQEHGLVKSVEFANSLYLVGHSLGAHISGFIGKDLGGQVGSLIALDPAAPSFRNQLPPFRLDRHDAQLVQVLHANGGVYGLYNMTGHLDFYPNGGKSQVEQGDWLGDLVADLEGENHHKAQDYYFEVLKHEKKLREALKALGKKTPENLSRHRLFAYRSDSYEQFRDGSTFLSACPSIVDMNEMISNGTDLEHCLVPIDFVTDYKVLRQQLKNRYHVELAPAPRRAPQPHLFFYAYKEPSYLNNHFLLKLYVSKNSKIKHSCAIEFNVVMSDGVGMRYKIGSYKLIEKGAHKEIVAPFLAPNFRSKYLLAQLDLHQFQEEHANRQEEEQLQRNLQIVFPQSIQVKGAFRENAHVRSPYQEEEPEMERYGCKLEYGAVVVRPLNKLNRYLAASYRPEAEGFLPKVEFIGSCPMSKARSSLASEADASGEECRLSDEEDPLTTVYLRTVSIGGDTEDGTTYDY